MFGDIVFATTPVPYAQIWINQCPVHTVWDDQDPNNLSTAKCHEVK